MSFGSDEPGYWLEEYWWILDYESLVWSVRTWRFDRGDFWCEGWLTLLEAADSWPCRGDFGSWARMKVRDRFWLMLRESERQIPGFFQRC